MLFLSIETIDSNFMGLYNLQVIHTNLFQSIRPHSSRICFYKYASDLITPGVALRILQRFSDLADVGNSIKKNEKSYNLCRLHVLKELK